jgi:hypothetical protein
MAKHTSRLWISMALMTLLAACSQSPENPSPEGLYFGQGQPGAEPRLFGPGFISTGLDESVPTFSPKGDEVFYSVFINGFSTIVTSRLENGRWTSPDTASFSGHYLDDTPAFHPDGSKLYFASNRPPSASGEPEGDINIWMVTKLDMGWSEPLPVGGAINNSGFACCPSVTQDGTMYFAAKMEDGREGIFRSRLDNGEYKEAAPLPGTVNSNPFQSHCWISPDESYLLLVAAGREDLIGAQWNYYISFRDEEDGWSELINPGETINSRRIGAYLSLSTNGRYLFFQCKPIVEFTRHHKIRLTYKSIQNRHLSGPTTATHDVFWMDAGVVEKLRPDGF